MSGCNSCCVGCVCSGKDCMCHWHIILLLHPFAIQHLRDRVHSCFVTGTVGRCWVHNLGQDTPTSTERLSQPRFLTYLSTATMKPLLKHQKLHTSMQKHQLHYKTLIRSVEEFLQGKTQQLILKGCPCGKTYFSNILRFE